MQLGWRPPTHRLSPPRRPRPCVKQHQLPAWVQHMISKIVVVLLLALPASSQSSDETAALLLEQRDAIVNWDSFAAANGIQGWNGSVPVCQWGGVDCDEGTVYLLDLHCDPAEASSMCAERAYGTLTPGLASIGSLQTVWLHGQNFTGTMPASWASRGSFDNLLQLWLQDNALSGTLPASWGAEGAFPNLNYLYLSGNRFSGSLPNSWASLPALMGIWLHNNQLNGSLPSAWAKPGMFSSLVDLQLANNSLTGPLPDAWSNENALPALTSVWLNGNRLNGSLPESWGSSAAFRSLYSLELTNNTLTGMLPTSWGTNGSWRALEYLFLDFNRLRGTIPESWGQPGALPKLWLIKLEGNDLCGPIPAAFSNKGIAGEPLARLPDCPSQAASGSSSHPGIIAGAVIGAVVVVATLTLLTLWRLRRRRLTAGAPVMTESMKAADLAASSLEAGAPLAPPSPLLSQISLQTATLSRPDTSQSNLTPSYITTAGAGKGWLPPSHPSSSQHSLESDPLLSLITTHLATRSAAPTRHSSSARTSAERDLPAVVQRWIVQWDEIQLIRRIGRGSYGRVYLATWRETPVAVKVLIAYDDTDPALGDLELPESVMRDLQQEAAVMDRMRHPNLVSFMGLCTLPPCILTEYCSRGSLFDVLRQAAADAQHMAELTWQLRLSMALDAGRGLLYLHLSSPPIIHQDVKSPNLLVDRSWNVKVCDFNLSAILRGRGQATTDSNNVTNPRWMAPELLDGQHSTRASDVYSFGLVLWELLTWTVPWGAASPFQIRRWVLDGRRPEVPPAAELPGPEPRAFTSLETYLQLMRGCWAQDPAVRPAIGEVVQRLSGLLEECRGEQRSAAKP